MSNILDAGNAQQADIFGHQIVVQPYNQVELRLDDADWADFVDTVTAGGGSGGTVTQGSGLVTVASGTSTTGSAILTSKDQVRYRPGVGVYAAGTAVFTAAAADSIQRAGIASDTSYTNSLTFGYNSAGVFGIRYTRGGVEVSFTAQADWDDPCLGGATSQFRRDGAPETLDPTKGNLYRFEAGLFGFAGWVAKVWSPDNGWIPVLTYQHINTGTAPVFTSNTFKVIIAATKTAGAGSLSVKSQCWGAGTGSNTIRLGSTQMSDRTLATPVRAVIAGRSTAGGTSYVNVKVNPSGTLAIGNESVSATGAAVPASATLVGGSDGTNLRAFVTDTGGVQKVRDDFALGQVLADQAGADAVLTFTFSAQVAMFWVAVVGDAGVCKVDHYGGTPSASSGIPVGPDAPSAILPIPEPATVVKVYAPTGTTVTVWGHFR